MRPVWWLLWVYPCKGKTEQSLKSTWIQNPGLFQVHGQRAARVQPEESIDTHVQHGRVQSYFRFTKVSEKVRARIVPTEGSGH